MLSHGLFWVVAGIFIVGQGLLIRSAWQLWRKAVQPPAGVPQSHGGTDLAWTVATALLTGVLLYYAYTALA